MKQYFRGRTYNTWVYGCHEYRIDGSSPEVHLIKDPRTGSSVLVDADTVTMSIGVKDIHKKDIFIGDIVKHYNHSDDPSHYEIGLIVWNEPQCCVSKKDEDGELWRVNTDCVYEVIGNIFDTPELYK